MDFNALIAELRTSSENLPKDSVDRSLLSSVYCNKACTVLDQIADNTDYDNTITGLWLVAAHFAEQLLYLKPVPALSELCFKLFRQCAKAVLNIQWQNLEEDSSLRQNFLASLAHLHAKLVPLDFPRFRLLEGLTENPWTNPTLAKVMGGEVEDSDKDEVRCYIEQEDPIILQLRVDMMLKENCEEYALNLCNSCLSHPELQSDLGVRKTQLSLLYKLGQEDKLQEECQKLSIQDAVRIIKQLQTSKTHRQICTVLAQTFMVQNWIRPSDMEANKELLRLWIRHQLLVDREQDQFKESVWAMAKLSQSTEQIIIFIDVLREECGETFLQLYVDMCIFAINVDKGQMETNKKEGNMEAAAARRSDMASICAKLSCLCHHASVKVARICVLTSFALKPTEQSFAKIGTFYGQGTDCCNKCGRDRDREPGTLNPATLYEVERLLNMLRPDYLSPDQSYVNIQILCRRFLQESLKNAQQFQRKQFMSQSTTGLLAPDTTKVGGPGNKLTTTSVRPTNVFEALSPQDFQNTQTLLNKMRLQNITSVKPSMPGSSPVQHIYQSSTSRSPILQPGQQPSFPPGGQGNKAQYVFDAERVKNKQPYGVPLEQQHQYYLIKHEKELEQRRKNAQKKREERSQQSINLNSQVQQPIPRLLQQQQHGEQLLKQQQHNEQVTQIIQTALKHDSNALQKLTHGASPEVVQAVLNIMKGSVIKPSATSSQQQTVASQQIKPKVSSSPHGTQPLPTVSTLLKPSVQAQQLQKHQPQTQQHHLQHKQQELQQPRELSPPKRHPRPQLYAQPIIASTSSNASPMRYQPPVATMLNNRNQVTQSSAVRPETSGGESQKGEGFMLNKSHVEDIRRFMQIQMSNLQQKQIAEPRQMSGSTVTVTNMSATKTASHTSFNLTNRPKTTVELAEQAALAKLRKQDISKSGNFQQSQQLKSNNGQIFSCQPDQMLPKLNQQQFTTSINRTNTNVQHQPTSHQQHQKFLNLQQQHNNIYSYQNNQSPNVASNSVLPSSDELSGSIVGIDDTIIKELLQDSGILANTFPDIEVDTIGEDKSRRIPEYSSLPQSVMPPVSNQMSKSSKSQLYYSSSAVPQTSYPSQSIQGHSVTKVSHPQHLASASYLQPPVSGTNKYSPMPPSVSSINSMSQSSQNRSINPSALNTFSGSNNQASSRPQLWPNTFSVNATPRDNISVLPKKEIKQESKPTVDQLREMMKKEDIQGEIYMDAANNATYRCIICSFAFETLDHLREHVRNVCKPGLQSSSVYNTKIKQDRANSAKAGVETTTVFQCLRCFELCVSDAGIKQHRLTCKRVPTVPSDLKKDVINNKQKALIKPAVTKQPQKKEPQDNSYKVPDLPLPFPYPSLNAEAVLKSMSMAGSFISQTQTSSSGGGSKSQTPVADVISKAAVAVPAPFHSISPRTSLQEPKTLPVSTISATPCNTNTPQTVISSVNVDAVKQTPACSPNVNISSISGKDTNVEPQNENISACNVGPNTSLVEKDLNTKDVDKITPKENPETISQPRCTEISGSGGSKFYKCGICSQTLCSLESFLVHWKECAVKNKILLRKIELKEKPITGEVLENLLGIIAAVAAGHGSIPETINLEQEWYDDEDDNVLSLRDPCKTGSCEDSDSATEYESESSVSQESQSDTDGLSGDKGDGSKTGSECANNVEGFMDRKDDHVEDNIDDLEEDDKTFKKTRKTFSEDTEDEVDSMSESEHSYVSTREIPPKLRDRKTLKPIHSFINETFNSPFAKSTVKPTSAKLDEKFKELTGDEKTSSDSEVESDGDSLYCKVCQTSYQTKRILLQHFAGKHLQPYTVKTVADSSSYFCHLCQKTFSTFMHYMQHVPNHSVTIYEKMKAFIASRKSQRSERIATQRGLAKKSNVIPKMTKTVKSQKAATKAAMDQLQQQILAGKTQSVRDRLRISKRKRSLPSTFTSSDDDYSSDASNNVVFKSKKSTESENWSDGQKPITRSRNARPRRLTAQPDHNQDDSSVQSSLDLSGEDSDRGTRRTRVRDEDYVLSEDLDSDGIDTPPTTRSRKRLVQNLELSYSKRRKPFSESETNEERVCEKENSTRKSIKYFWDTNLSDSDGDSSSSDLIFQCKNGIFVPISNKLEAHNELCDTSFIKEVPKTADNSRALEPTPVLFVRSLTKRQKERLKSCDLQPTVALETLCLDNLEMPLGHDMAPTRVTLARQQIDTSLDKMLTSAIEAVACSSSGEVSTSAPVKNKTSSFLDSFLSYLNQYPSPEKLNEPGRKRNVSGPPGVKGSQKRRTSYDLSQVSAPSQSSANQNLASSAEVDTQERVGGSEAVTSSSSIHPSNSSQGTDQNILSKFPTKPCSVNLGQKLSLEDFQTKLDFLIHEKTATHDKTIVSTAVSDVPEGKTDICDKTIVSTAVSDVPKGKTDISSPLNASSKSKRPTSDVKEIAIASLERSDKMDSSEPLAAGEPIKEKNSSSKSVLSEVKPVEQIYSNDCSSPEFTLRTNESHEVDFRTSTVKGSSDSSSSSASTQSLYLNNDLNSQQLSDVSKIETANNTFKEMETVDIVADNSEQKEFSHTEIEHSDVEEEMRITHLDSVSTSSVPDGSSENALLSSKTDDSEKSDISAGSLCCGSGLGRKSCEDKEQSDCLVTQNSSTNDCDSLVDENMKGCDSENVLELDGQISAHSATLDNEGRCLIPDVSDATKNADNLVSSNTFQDSDIGDADAYSNKSIVIAQNIQGEAVIEEVEMPCVVTKLEQTELQDTSVLVSDILHSSPQHLLQEEQDSASHSSGHSDTVADKLENNSAFENSLSRSNSEQKVIEAREEQKLSDAIVSEKITADGLTTESKVKGLRLDDAVDSSARDTSDNDSIKTRKQDMIAESSDKIFKAEDADLSCDTVKSSNKLMPQMMLPCDTCLVEAEILEKVDTSNLDRTDSSVLITDVNNSDEKGKTVETLLMPPEQCHTTNYDGTFLACDVSVQNQNVNNNPEVGEFYKVVDELSNKRATNEEATFMRGVEELEKMSSVQNSTVVKGSDKTVTVKCQDNTRVHIEKPSKGRDEFDLLGPVTNTLPVSPGDKSNDDTSMKPCQFDEIKQKTTLPTKEESLVNSLGACKINRSLRKKDSEVKVILNPNISLAAFIAERLTKEDLEPSADSRISQADKVIVRQIDQDAPLDIAGHAKIVHGCPMNITSPTHIGPSCAIDITSRSQIGLRFPMDITSHARIGPSFPMDITRCTQVGQRFPANITSHAQVGPNFPMNISGHAQIGPNFPMNSSGQAQVGQSFPMDITSHTQIGPNFPMDITSRTLVGPSFPMDNASRTQVGPSFPMDTTSRAQIDTSLPMDNTSHAQIGSDFPMDSSSYTQADQSCPPFLACHITGPSCIKPAEDSCHLEVSPDKVKPVSSTVQSSCLVDYSSSESEEDFKYDDEVNDADSGKINLQVFDRNENKAGLQSIKNNTSIQVQQLGKANCGHSKEMPTSEHGILQKLHGESKICASIQEVGCVSSSNQTYEKTDLCRPQCGDSTKKFDSLLECNPSESQYQYERLGHPDAGITIDQSNSNLCSYPKKIHGDKPQKIDLDIMEEIDISLKENASPNGTLIADKNNSIIFEPTQNKMSGDDLVLIREEKAKTSQQHITRKTEANVLINNRNELSAESSSQLPHIASSLRALETNDNAKEDEREVHDVVFRKIEGKNCEENIKSNVQETYSELPKDVPERNVSKVVSQTTCRNMFGKNIKQNVYGVGYLSQQSEYHEDNVMGKGCDVILETHSKIFQENDGNKDFNMKTHDFSRGNKQADLFCQTACTKDVEEKEAKVTFEDEVNLLSPVCTEVVKDKDVYARDTILASPQTFSSPSGVLNYQNHLSSGLDECSKVHHEADFGNNLIMPHVHCDEENRTAGSTSSVHERISKDGSIEMQATISGKSQTTDCHTILDVKVHVDTTDVCECEYNIIPTHSGIISDIDFLPGEKSKTVLQKSASKLVVAEETEITSTLPEMKKHISSEQQLSTSERAVLGCSNVTVELCSEDKDTKDLLKQLSGSIDLPAKKILSGLKEGDSKGVALIDQPSCVVVDSHSKVDMNQDQKDVFSEFGQTEAFAVSEVGGTLVHSNKSIKSGGDNSGSDNQIEIRKRFSVTLPAAGNVQSDPKTEMSSLPPPISNEFASEKDSSTNIANGSSSTTLDKPDSPGDRKNTGNETDEGDDLSDFDLVIENDTSYRSQSFPITFEKKSYSPVLPHSSSLYATKGKTNYIPSSTNTPTLSTSGLVYNRGQEHQFFLSQQSNPSLRKPLGDGKNFRQSSQGQFVWDVDDDIDCYRNPVFIESRNIPFTSSLAMKNASFAIEATSNPALEALNRKQKALREKAETAPFTWDLEDFADNSSSKVRSTLTIKSSSKINDILSFDLSSHAHNKNTVVNKIRRKITQRKRPLTPDVSPGKMPAKFRRTSSVDRQTKSSSFPVGKELRRQREVESKGEDETVNIDDSLQDAEKFNSNSITVDEDVSFKIDSFSPPLGIISSIDVQSSQTGNQFCSIVQETKLRRGERSHKQSHITSQSTVAQQDERFESNSHVDEVDAYRNMPGLRSRHSSMESNKSDKSVTPKRGAETVPQMSYRKRFRKIEDPLTPKLKKIGLIKISKDSHSPPSSSGSDCSAPVTRSSEAAIKAFNQKSLRSRGVNLVQPIQCAQNVHLKTSPESNSKFKGSISVPKSSMSSSNIVRNYSPEPKTELSPKSSIKKSHSSDTSTVAIVKRRSPTVPVATSGVVTAKTPLVLRSKKGIPGRSKTHHSTSSTIIFRVDPLPGTTENKGMFKSQVTPISKGIRTLHTPLPPGTSAVMPKKDTSKQPKWRIKKETKLGRGKKQQRGPLSFKRT